MRNGDVSRVLRRRLVRVAVIASAIVVVPSAAAYALTGYVAQDGQVAFYYGETSGHGDSNNFHGYGSARLCADAAGQTSNNTFVASYIKNVSFAPDTTIRDVNLRYSENEYKSAYFSTSSSSTYHVKSDWSAVPSAPDYVGGYVRAGDYVPC